MAKGRGRAKGCATIHNAVLARGAAGSENHGSLRGLVYGIYKLTVIV